ncbi:MAG: hypothetical protein KC425_10050, partial [Anaerolineales bacterium]|nr:hypothetical protein [Anaerolineales bacterium]
HTVSARLAGAPMDVILLGADMPRTLYFDNQVTPRQHIGRSLGGPVYSGPGLLLGIGWLLLAPDGTAVRYLGEVWALAHGGIFLGAFAPLQIVDGGVILKWALVLRGHGEAQAERIVRRLAVGVGVILVVVMGAWLVWR